MDTNTSSASEPRRRGRPAKASLDAAALIRAAALDAFATHGFNGASIVDIAKAAAVAKPLIHYHFATKEALWQAAVGEAFECMKAEMAAFQQSIVSSQRNDLLRQVAKQMVIFASRHPQLVRIVVDETGKPGPRAEWLLENYLLPGYRSAQLLVAAFDSPRRTDARTPGPEHMVPMILGVMNFPFLDAEIIHKAYGVDVFAADYIQRHSEVVFTLLQAYYVPVDDHSS